MKGFFEFHTIYHEANIYIMFKIHLNRMTNDLQKLSDDLFTLQMHLSKFNSSSAIIDKRQTTTST